MSIQDFFDEYEGNELDWSNNTVGQKQATVGFSTTAQESPMPTKKFDNPDVLSEQPVAMESPASRPLPETKNMEEDEEFVLVEKVFHKDIRALKAPLMQMVVRRQGSLRVLVPDSILEKSALFVFAEEKEHFVEREYNLPEEDVFSSSSVYLCEEGVHCIVVGVSSLYYINFAVKGFSPTVVDLRAENVEGHVASLCFDTLEKSNKLNTGKIIVSTENGTIFEMVIETKERKKKGADITLHVQKLFELGDKTFKESVNLRGSQKVGKVNGIRVLRKKRKKNLIIEEKKPMEEEGGSEEPQQVYTYYVYISTDRYFLEFTGDNNTATLKRVFDLYIDKTMVATIVELPSETKFRLSNEAMNCSLQIVRGEIIGRKSFITLGPSGVIHGLLSFSQRSSSSGGDGKKKKDETRRSGIVEMELICTDDAESEVVAVAALEFQIIILYIDRLVIYLQPPALCMRSTGNEDLQDDVVPIIPITEIKIEYEHIFGEDDGRPKGLQCLENEDDDMIIFVYTTKRIFQFTIDLDVARKNVWRLYLYKAKRDLESSDRSRRLFDFAKALCVDKTDPISSKRNENVVLSAQADFFFSNEQYSMAARTYARTTENFEEVSLRFHSKEEHDSLRLYLEKKLEQLVKIKREDNTTQLFCLCAWLTELYLNKLNQLKGVSDESGKRLQKDVRKRFRGFLVNRRQYLHKETTFNLISSHGQIDNLLFFAKTMKEYDFVISHYLIAKMYDKALETIVRYCSHKKYKRFWYKYVPLLIEHKPNEIITAIRGEKTKFLDPTKLLPALMRYIAVHPLTKLDHSILEYLQYVIRTLKNKNPTIHNLLLYLYAQLDDEKPLLNLLKSQHANYNEQYALRICLEKKKIEGCIYLYSKMDLFEDAVQLALDIGNIDLAKEFAEKSEDIELAKKLWLKIAKYVIKEKNIKEALRILYGGTSDLGDSEDDDIVDLREQNPYLKFETILQYFDDNVKIEDFKQEICNSLDNYNRDIEKLKVEMKEQANDLQHIREDIKNLKHKHYYLSPTTKCESCRFSLLPADFYLFPCNHVYHTDCLLKEVKEYANEGLKSQIDKCLKNSTQDNKKLLRSLISRECPFCGDMMINTIDIPLISKEEVKRGMDWNVEVSSVDLMIDFYDESQKSAVDGVDDFEKLRGQFN